MNMQMYYEYAQKDDVKSWVNTTLSNYLGKNPHTLENEVEHILDYLNSDSRPYKISKMSYGQAKTNAEKWSAILQKKAGGIVEVDSDVEVVKDFGDGFKLVTLVSKAAYDREGAMMRNCVSSYFNKKDSKIYSLRDAQNNPHCTMEVVIHNNEIYQIKGKGNGPIHPNYISYILQALKEIGNEVRLSEMSNLGYNTLDAYVWRFLEENFEGIKYITYQNTKLFYIRSSLKPKLVA